MTRNENPGQKLSVAGYRLLKRSEPNSDIPVSKNDEHANIAPVTKSEPK